MRWLVLSVVAAVLLVVAAEKVRYDNYHVYRIMPKTEQQLESLRNLRDQSTKLSFWRDVSKTNVAVDVMVPPESKGMFVDFLKRSRFDFTVLVDNLQEMVEDEERMMMMKPKAFGWTNYYVLDDIYGFLDDLAAKNDNVSVIVGGTTYEGREIRGLKITNGANLPGMIFESGIHAREWIGPAASSWIVNQIVNSPADSIWRQFNYIYFPSVNPDGYEFTHTKDRMWRKTRTPYLGGLCFGADPNRNYGYHWNEGGSSNNPCSETYAGPTAFSEVETKSMSDFLTSVSSSYPIHIAVHSYSQLLMFPWGYTATHTPMHNTWQRIGDLAATALEKVHGTSFDVGNIYETIYQTSGTSTEWYYGAFNATITYTFELRDTGKYGFLLPPEQIVPVSEELIAAIQVILEEYQKL